MAQGDLSGYKRGSVKSDTRELVNQFHAEEKESAQELVALEQELLDDESEDSWEFEHRGSTSKVDGAESVCDFDDDGFDMGYPYYDPFLPPARMVEDSWSDGDH